MESARLSDHWEEIFSHLDYDDLVECRLYMVSWACHRYCMVQRKKRQDDLVLLATMTLAYLRHLSPKAFRSSAASLEFHLPYGPVKVKRYHLSGNSMSSYIFSHHERQVLWNHIPRLEERCIIEKYACAKVCLVMNEADMHRTLIDTILPHATRIVKTTDTTIKDDRVFAFADIVCAPSRPLVCLAQKTIDPMWRDEAVRILQELDAKWSLESS